MIIDIFTHIYPTSYYEAMCKAAPQLENLGKRMRGVTKLHDLDERFREMDAYGDYRQIISLPVPPIDDIVGPELAPTLARIANDSMAELCRTHADRFAAFVAAVPMLDIEAALGEIDRAIDDLGAKGIQLYTSVAGRPLDDPGFLPVFDAMAGDWEIEDAVPLLRRAVVSIMNGYVKTGDDESLDVLTATKVGQTMRNLIDEVLENGKRYLEERAAQDA